MVSAEQIIKPGETYRYWLDVVRQGGVVRSIYQDVTVAPNGLSLNQNVPNPFNPKTTITYGLDRNDHVTLTIHNVTGQWVRTLVDQSLVAGPHSATWDGTDSNGGRVASGVYFYRYTSGARSLTKKMVLLK